MADSMRLNGSMAATIGIAATVVSGPFAPAAWADGPVVLGGGAGIVVNGTYCALGTIGHDGSGELVGFTASRCGGPGSQVTAEGSGVSVGSVVATSGDPKYVVIKFDPSKVAPVAAFDGFAINGIGPDPVLGQGVCAHNGATGDVCGSVLIPAVNAPSTLVVNMPVGQWHPGDEGEPFTVDGLLVGLSNHGYTLPAVAAPPVTHTGLTFFSAIMNDVNAKGGPGERFTPIPA